MPRLRLALILVLLLFVPPLAASDKPAPPDKAVETFDAAWELIHKTHYDPHFHGVDWNKVRTELRPKAEAAKTVPELRAVLRDMLSRLGESHFGLIPREAVDGLEAKGPSQSVTGTPAMSKPSNVPPSAPDQANNRRPPEAAKPAAPAKPEPRKHDTAAKPELSKKTEPAKPEPATTPERKAAEGRGDVGLDLRLLDTHLVVTRVAPDAPAARAGVQRGWILKSVDGQPMAKLLRALPKQGVEKVSANLLAWRVACERLHGPVGSKVRLEFLDADDEVVKVELKRRREPGEVVKFGNLPPLHASLESERVQTEAGRAVGVIRFNIWLAPLAPEFDKAIDRLRGTAGLVIDLRGNPGGVGGMAPGLAGHFLNKPLNLGTMKMRGSEFKFMTSPRRVTTDGRRVEPYAGPLAILIDQASLSTSEIFAGGLQTLGRARLFGQTTGGAALPSQLTRLPNGDVLQHAIANFTTGDGKRLEGHGVTPDEAVTLTRADLLTGHDPVLQAALRWIDSPKK